MLNVESNHDIHWGEYNRKDCLGTIWVLVISQFVGEFTTGSVSWDTKMVVSPDASYTRIKKGMARSATVNTRTQTRCPSLLLPLQTLDNTTLSKQRVNSKDNNNNESISNQRK